MGALASTEGVFAGKADTNKVFAQSWTLFTSSTEPRTCIPRRSRS